MGRRWIKEDLDTLNELWGAQRVPVIAKRLKRTKDAIIEKARALGYDTQIDHQGWYPVRKVSALLGVRCWEIYRWVSELGLPVHHGHTDVFHVGRPMLTIALDELAKFITSRPELVDPDWLSTRLARVYLFDTTCLNTRYTMKRMVCPHAASKRSGDDHVFWVGIRNHYPKCPVCFKRVRRYAVSDENGVRYRE